MNNAGNSQIFGFFIAGYATDRFGFKKTMLVALIFTTLFIFVEFFSTSIVVLFLGEFLMNIPFGIFTTVAISYADNVAPLALRGYLTSYINYCWLIGQLIGAGVLRGVEHITTEWGYRIPLGLQWMWQIPLITACILAPESPVWLVRKGRIDDAIKSLKRLTRGSANQNFDAEKTVAMMVHAHSLEKETDVSQSYLALFKGTNLRRTLLGAFVINCQYFGSLTLL